MTWILPKQLHTSACALDTAALSLDSNESSRICAQSLFVRSKPLPLPTWLRKWKRDSWTQHLSGRILRPSLGKRFETEWTSLLAVTPASPSAAQESGPARMTRGIYGPTSQMAFDFSGRDSASLRTSKDISAWGCPTSSKTWQEWVIERRGAYSARLNSAHRTSGSGCSSWPSPVASEVRQGFQDRSRGMKGSQESLTTVVIKHGHPAQASSSTDGSRRGLWQTATVSTGAHKQKDGSMIDKLDQQVKQWATPRAGKTTDENPETWKARQQKGDVATMPLTAQVKSWATPKVHEHMEPPDQWKARNIKKKSENPKLGTLHKPLGTMVAEYQPATGKLNPRWVETLMGLPVGWTMPSCVSPVTIAPTSFDSSETASSQPRPSGPSGC